jgi:DNA-binding transcriptional LysR family regulator
MDLKRLRTFVAVAELGTVSGAATRLHIAQPALSRQIIDLERELGINLFDRVARRLRLTREGEQLLERSRTLLSHASALSAQAQKLRRGDAGTLRVAASPQMIDNVLSLFLHRYAKRYPAVQVRLVEGFGEATLKMVERGDVQLGAIVDEAVPPEADHFGRRPLMSNIHIGAYGAVFSLARSKPIEIRDLASYPLLVLDQRHVQRKTFDAACRLAKVRANIIFECSSPHSLLSLAEAGHGIAVVPSNVRLHRCALKAVEIAHARKLLAEPLSIFWDKRRALPRYAHDFCELRAGYIRTVIPTAQELPSDRMMGKGRRAQKAS